MEESRVELRCMVEDPSLALRLHPTAACLLLGRDGQSSNIRIRIVKRRKAKEWPGKDSIQKVCRFQISFISRNLSNVKN